ncbi:hypothetical protein HL653_17615 [Sphingomonas sp. AP4-R1]|uniref:hypothetical protein n=1 Tax=Sphingomonas sp. AP4-R1 TaxID=2735134 RepID=UPI001493B193|nr:hypothetical protein [Sphingomonas sp. AP4-R1]QJU56372.1 hypothetical protein HL653_17615 [Sphingomonas sp. AP4-R1]
MEKDKAYFYQRAETELKLAQQAVQPAVVKAHYQLAGYYLDRVYGNGEQADLSDRHIGAPLPDALRKKADGLAAQLRAAGVIIVGPFVDS